MSSPQELFKYPWKIAEFIISGNRRERDEQYKIINISLYQHPRDRLKIEDIVAMLETMSMKMHK